LRNRQIKIKRRFFVFKFKVGEKLLAKNCVQKWRVIKTRLMHGENGGQKIIFIIRCGPWKQD
jgi:hypothetical protein